MANAEFTKEQIEKKHRFNPNDFRPEVNLSKFYESIIKSKTLVLFFTGVPGSGKSSMMQEIADRNEWLLIDLRIAEKDASEIGGIPRSVDIPYNLDATKGKDAITTKMMEYDAPSWFIQANTSIYTINPLTNRPYKGALIFCDELNRASLEQRNATLRLLLDKMIDFNKKLMPYVHLASAGNLGDEDGCEVEIFDNSLKNRLHWHKHVLTTEQWANNFANVINPVTKVANVNPIIVEFLKANPDHVYVKPKDDDNAFASFRSWTALSEHARTMTADGSHMTDMVEFRDFVSVFSEGKVGKSATRLLSYLNEIIRASQIINIPDILKDYDAVKGNLKKCNRDTVSKLINELIALDLNSLSKTNITNLKKFLKDVDKDEMVAYLGVIAGDDRYITDDSKMSTNFESLKDEFDEYFEKIFNSLQPEFVSRAKKVAKKTK